MKTKMGRPRLPKAKIRAVLVQARLSSEEHKTIEEAVKRAKAIKSDWIREALLEKAAA